MHSKNNIVRFFVNKKQELKPLRQLFEPWNETLTSKNDFIHFMPLCPMFDGSIPNCWRLCPFVDVQLPLLHNKKTQLGWWFQPIWNTLVSWDYHPISRVEPLVTSPVYSYVSCFFSLENNNLRNRMKNVLDLGLDPVTFAPDCAGPVLLPPGGSDQGSNEKPDRITQIILLGGWAYPSEKNINILVIIPNWMAK